MRQLSGVDVSFLNMETPSVFGHVSSLNLYDPTSAPGGGGLEATLEETLQLEHERTADGVRDPPDRLEPALDETLHDDSWFSREWGAGVIDAPGAARK